MTHVDNSLQSVDDWLIYGVIRHFQKYFSLSWRSVLLVIA